MTTRVFIDGAAGTTGLEIRERLDGRTDLSLSLLCGDARRDPAARAAAMAEADIAILCLPDDAAREAAGIANAAGTRLIDASSAHRVSDGWIYGFPEIEPGRRAGIAAASRVSNPGCYPTGFLALVRPLVRAGLLPADTMLGVNATSGYSGGGKAMIAEFQAPGASAFRPYALNLGHKHVPEMRVHAGLSVAPIFAPAVANTYRGMIVEVALHLDRLASGTRGTHVADAIGDAYAGERLVRLVRDRPPTLEIDALAGCDRVDLFAFIDEQARQCRLVAVLDNLGKGASGAAVQSLNLMTGADELTGLHL